jgi:hypothetical protein
MIDMTKYSTNNIEGQTNSKENTDAKIDSNSPPNEMDYEANLVNQIMGNLSKIMKNNTESGICQNKLDSADLVDA